MAECDALRLWAEALPIVPQTPAADSYVIKRLMFMQAVLPARVVDDAVGEKRTAVYLAILRTHSWEALEYMADRAIRTLRWFPTPKECLDLLAEHRAPESERSATLRVCSAFAQDAFERWIMNVRGGQPIGEVPDHWMRIAVEHGVMRRLQDGSYVSRALYQGPVKAYASEQVVVASPCSDYVPARQEAA